MLDGPAHLALTDDEIDYLDLLEEDHRRQMRDGSRALLEALSSQAAALMPTQGQRGYGLFSQAVADRVISAVADVFLLKPASITGPRRNSRFVDARAAVVFIMMHRGWSFNQIGKALGGRDHSTICNIWNKRDIYTMRSKPLQVCMERLGHLAKKGAL